MAAGRPTDYTQELADKICSKLSEGISMRTVCLAEDMPDASTVFRWLRTDKEFCQQYTRAKEESSDAMAEEILDLSDAALPLSQKVDPKSSGAVVQAARLQVDTRKWIMSKMKPKKYGEKIDMTTNGKDLPVPLLHVLRDNNRNPENSSPEQKN